MSHRSHTNSARPGLLGASEISHAHVNCAHLALLVYCLFAYFLPRPPVGTFVLASIHFLSMLGSIRRTHLGTINHTQARTGRSANPAFRLDTPEAASLRSSRISMAADGVLPPVGCISLAAAAATLNQPAFSLPVHRRFYDLLDFKRLK